MRSKQLGMSRLRQTVSSDDMAHFAIGESLVVADSRIVYPL